MPKGFSEEEIERIRAALLSKGSEIISKKGLRKTTVEELARSAGIAKGSFYKFFATKEELYFNAVLKVGEIKKHLVQKWVAEDSGKDGFRALLTTLFTLDDQNELLAVMNDPEERAYIFNKMPLELMQKHAAEEEVFYRELAKEITQKGGRPLKPSQLDGVFHSLFFLTLHKNDYEEDAGKESLAYLIKVISEDLFKEIT